MRLALAGSRPIQAAVRGAAIREARVARAIGPPGGTSAGADPVPPASPKPRNAGFLGSICERNLASGIGTQEKQQGEGYD